MASITDPNINERFTKAMEEMQDKQLKIYRDIIDSTSELCQSQRHYLKSALDTCLKKCKDDEVLFETIQDYKRDFQEKKVLIKEKKHILSETMAVSEQKDIEKDELMQQIEKLREDQAKRKGLIESQYKANKDRLRNLNKARGVFQDHLGMEIRSIRGEDKGEMLQFVYRNINPSDLDSPYIITMGIKEDRSYHIVSSDPKLESLPVLEKRLQETNNLPAFLAHIRKEFISQAR